MYMMRYCRSTNKCQQEINAKPLHQLRRSSISRFAKISCTRIPWGQKSTVLQGVAFDSTGTNFSTSRINGHDGHPTFLEPPGVVLFNNHTRPSHGHAKLVYTQTIWNKKIHGFPNLSKLFPHILECHLAHFPSKPFIFETLCSSDYIGFIGSSTCLVVLALILATLALIVGCIAVVISVMKCSTCER